MSCIGCDSSRRTIARAMAGDFDDFVVRRVKLPVVQDEPGLCD